MKGLKLKFLIPVLLVVALILFTYVALVSEIKKMSNDKLNKQITLNERQNRIEMKIVEIQQLTGEDRIVKLAQDSLKLVRPSKEVDVITVQSDQIKKIEMIVNSKYE